MISPAITELTTLTAPPAILAEWLALYFDGGEHAVGQNAPVPFPRADIAFGQGAPRAPLNSGQAETPVVEIRVITIPLFTDTHRVDDIFTDGRNMVEHVRLQFQIRAKEPAAKQSQYAAAKAAELLHGLLGNPEARYPISPLGIASLSPAYPEVVPGADYALRFLGCAALLHYRVTLPAAVEPPAPPCVPSYDNPGGMGDRSSLITVTADAALYVRGTPQELADGVRILASGFYFVLKPAAGSFLTFYFNGAAVVINEAKFYQSGPDVHGQWQWQGSNDGASWADLGGPFELGGAFIQTQNELSGNSSSYQYYRLAGVSGSTSDSPYVWEMEFQICQN